MIEILAYSLRVAASNTTIRSHESNWTADDWELLDHGVGTIYEIIDGVLYMTSMPSIFHQWINGSLQEFVGIPFKRAGLGYAYQAPIGVFMAGTQPVQPDFVMIKRENGGMIRNRRITGIPDLIAEILSPGNSEHDLKVKYEAYERAGVPEYVIVRPAERALTHFRLNDDGKYNEVGTFSGESEVAFDLAPNIRFRVQDLFDGSPDTTL